MGDEHGQALSRLFTELIRPGLALLGIEQVLFDNICGNGCKLRPRVDGAGGHAASTTISSSHAMDSHLLNVGESFKGFVGGGAAAACPLDIRGGVAPKRRLMNASMKAW
ncbi:hypothetical protein QYQ99_23605 [Comamonas testosteroni]|uniref:hypothetical protein n=1 Tax=Comamonas testosteroni TaxID=285 RepID=UPI00265FD11D|nr:hypothetical protein [Comamonas testosteroni]WKL15305.1 hypothetical protein QYQ99_23605 [Comamonas testosteroni]